MARADIRVDLRGGEEEGGYRRYAPGESISGSVEIIPDGDVRCNHPWVRLRWHTEGRGDRDQANVVEQDLFQGTLRAGFPSSYDFQLALPREPWSYAGHYINIIWEIAVDADVPWSINPRHSQPFVMAPSRQPGESDAFRYGQNG